MHARSSWLSSVLAALLLVLGTPAVGVAQEFVVPEAPMPGVPGGVSFDDDSPLRGYVNVDAIFWTRNMPGVPLAINGTTGQAIASTSSVMDFNTSAAPGITWGHMIDDYLGIEGSYFGFYDWKASGLAVLSAADAPTAAAPFRGLPPLTFTAGDYQRFEYQSDLTSVELNMREDLTDRFTLLWGFRYLNLDEHFRGTVYESTNTVFGNYNIRAQNNLFGFQVGGQETFWLTESWTLSLHGKVGVFGNAAQQTTSGSFLDGGVAAGSRTASDARASVVAQLGLQTAVQLSRHIAIRGGYQAFFVDNVALAPSQITTSNWATGGAGGISMNNELLAHGGNIGLEITW